MAVLKTKKKRQSSVAALSKKLEVVGLKGDIAKIPLQIETTKTLIKARKVNTALTQVALQAQKQKLKKTPVQRVQEQTALLAAKQQLANLKQGVTNGKVAASKALKRAALIQKTNKRWAKLGLGTPDFFFMQAELRRAGL